MNYRKIYNQIIKNRKFNEVEGYTEKHHILPRSLGGTDEKNNLINLTAREHFLCHFLLAKMYEKETFGWYKMNHAFLMMKCESYNQIRYFNSRLYESLKKNFSNLMSLVQNGKNNSQYGTMWICNIELKENRKIRKYEEIPEGWIKGRNSWNKKNTAKKTKRENLKLKEETMFYWNLFKNGEYYSLREFCRNIYPKSHVIFTKHLKKYISEYNSRQGKCYSHCTLIPNTI